MSELNLVNMKRIWITECNIIVSKAATNLSRSQWVERVGGMVSLDEINYVWIQNNLWTRHIGYKYWTSSFFFDMMKIDVIVRNSTQLEKYDSPVTNFIASEKYARSHRRSVDVKLLSIRVMSHECQGIWNNWQLNRLFRLIAKKQSKLPYNCPFVQEIYHSQRVSNVENISMSLCHHKRWSELPLHWHISQGSYHSYYN